ncbi:unnamed protein product, partial [Rotaria socialis]
TRLLNQHVCDNSKADGTSTQQSLATFYITKTSKLKESEVLKVKDLQAKRICQNIRLFSIVKDDGLRHLIQECISIGARHRHGNIDVDQVLRVKELVEPLENDGITFCPDMWSDPVHQVSYLGIVTTFVNDQFEYRSYHLCCCPFEEEDKTSKSITSPLQKKIKRFGVDDISFVKFASDRGPNFVKALKNYTSYFCFGQRLNDILVMCFYQNEPIKVQIRSSTGSMNGNIFSSKDFIDSSIAGDDIAFVEISKTNVKDLPNFAREVLKTLNNCKDIVKYVKLVS